MNYSSVKILVIVPAFNESENIARTIEDIRKQGLCVDIAVINDGSLDNTAEIAETLGVIVVSLPVNLGIGGAVQTGFKYALEKNYDIAIQMDGDGQHDGAYLTKLINPILEHQADMVIGSRFMDDNQGFKSSFSRRIGINFFVRLINFFTRLSITDPTSGFRAHNKALIEVFAHSYPQDFPEPEAIVVAKRLGFTLCDVPVVMRARRGGQSSIRQLKSLYYMLKVTFAICLHMIRTKEGR